MGLLRGGGARSGGIAGAVAGRVQSRLAAQDDTAAPPDQQQDDAAAPADQQQGDAAAPADQQQGDAAAPPEQASAEAADSAGGTNLVAQLQQLEELHQQGALSDQEFASAKAKLLGG